MFYAGRLTIWEKDEKSLSLIFRHKEGYAINYKIFHNKTADFKIMKLE